MNSRSKTSFELNNSGEFIIENYNAAKPFSSFFPGIAGKTGIPMWVFFVNRGQGICSMGIQDKDNPIMEFLPANWAYQLVSSQGFRTFIKFPNDSKIKYYEPFQDHYQDEAMQKTQRMFVSSSHLTLEEVNETLGLKFQVEYHTVPEDQYAGLIRTLHIENIGTQEIAFEGLDGLPLIIPHGLNNFALKHLRRLTEAFVEVTNYDHSAPLFKGKVEPADRPEVVRIIKGNFYIGLEATSEGTRLLQPIVDPQRIFGPHNDYSHPANFLESDFDTLLEGQVFENRLPSAMSLFKTELAAGDSYTLTSIIGHIDSKETLNQLMPTISKAEYLKNKKQVSHTMIDELTAKNLIISSEPVLDLYVRQNFLDNVLRGGFPYTLKGKKSDSVLHLFSRRHGDLERDYNDYRITPTNFSQGNGAYRDVNQNRRSDLLFNPDVKSGNLEHFYNLIQLDGFNPLVIKELRYIVKDSAAASQVLKDHVPQDRADSVLDFLKESRTPGELLVYLHQNGVELSTGAEAFLGDLLAVCHKIHDTDHGEGYWSDHWTYNLDLLENYLAIYPEKIGYILFEKQNFTFHDSPYLVHPRDEKYVIWDGKTMQLEAVYLDKQKEALIHTRQQDRNSVRTQYGSGVVYHTFLITKMLSLITNKMASLDPSGIGVEMESDKPNWYDALNGLSAIMGSSLSETMEIKRNILFLLEAINEHGHSVADLEIFEELAEFISTLAEILENDPEPFSFWDQANSAKEKFRSQIILGIAGVETRVSISALKTYLEACLSKLETGINMAWDMAGKIPSTYFNHEVVEHELIQVTEADGSLSTKTNSKGLSCFRVKSFRIHHLPHFLEGPVHFLRCQPETSIARKLVEDIRKSDLYDTKLGMYKVNAVLDDEPMEIGRARVFSPGWFENESIWLHMEYKYMYEILRNGLNDIFFDEFKKVFIPFQKPEIYGRSILENSSFIVSSANPDKSLHGTGFVARLSGATAEFIQILMHMAMGPKPFVLNNQSELEFQLQPVLPGWLFTTKTQRVEEAGINDSLPLSIPANTFSFMFLGEIMVTYHNPAMKNTYGSEKVIPKQWKILDNDGNTHQFEGNSIIGKLATEIRQRQVSRIDVTLA
ncbi:MAG: hypothetical protein HQ507_06630 [Candidatus Marinimicrobia bacterium]|nr:hypothetical protein [Candidatus Neomarinimicrobiota bacterium]